MMFGLIDMLICYGICFGLMNKALILHGKVAILDKMLSCSYCTGFHCGWLWYVITALLKDNMGAAWQVHTGSILAYAFGASAFCYLADAATQLIEGWTPREAPEAEEEA